MNTPHVGIAHLSLNYEFDEAEGVVRLTHPSLWGGLTFSYSSPALAEIQLNAIRLDKPKHMTEEILADIESLIDSAKQLKEIVGDLKKKPNG